MREKKRKYRKIVLVALAVFFSLLMIYLGISAYFMNRFYFGSSINSISVFGKTVNEAQEELADIVTNYTLTLHERGGVKEEISGKDIKLVHNLENKIQSLKDEQSPFLWVKGLFIKKDNTLTEMVTFDEKLLKEKIDKLKCFQDSNVILPKNPTFTFTGKGYEIVKEVNGNKVNREILYKQVKDSIVKGISNINLEEINCYEKPKYNSQSKEILDTKNLLNKYGASKITYNFGKNTEVLDASKFNTWIKIDEKYEITIDEGKVKTYIETLSNKYDTYGTTRSFVTSLGATKKVRGGNYGWLINKSKEVKELVEAIKTGETITKKPIYAQTAFGTVDNDIGNTYLEIDLTKQYLWFYKNGTLITKGSVVTGNVSSNHTTPSGTYKLTYKQKDAVLRGPGYAAPVTYWMPFNGGIGLHDASWRAAFGGEIYKTNGSHGCINAPYQVAEAVFKNIEAGIPVVCYH